MNKKLFYAMSRRRVSCPQITQQLWDAIKTIRYQRQVPDIDRISRYMSRVHNVSQEEVTRQLNYCVRDGLLQLTKKIGFKGSKIGVEQEGYKLPQDKVAKDSHDWYCFECHRGGDVISCNTCHRVYHLACISKEELPETDVKHKFICNVCKMCETKETSFEIKKSQLNRLLSFTCTRLKSRLPVPLTERQVLSNNVYVSDRAGAVRRPSTEVPSNMKWVLDEKDTWRQDYLIYRPMDLQTMESKADAGKYEHLEEFKADAQTIVHNVVIFHGVHSNVADHARLMLRDCIYDLQEIRQCRDCYKVSNEKTNKHWFCKPCRPPHMLVYAKQKGFPYWPAKVIKIEGDHYDVRFFGGLHQRAVIEKSYIRPISVNIHTLQVKRTSSWNKACEELKKHQDLLEKLRVATNNFTTAPPDSSSESEAESTHEEAEEEDQAAKDRDREMSEDEDNEEEDDTEEEETVDTPRPPTPQPPPAPSITTPPVKRKPGRPSTGRSTGRRPGRPPLSAKPGARRPGRPPKVLVDGSPLSKTATAKPQKTSGRGRGRPPGAKNKATLLKERLAAERELLKKIKLEEKEKEELQEEESKCVEEKVEITSTFVPDLPSKKEEEEMVSSSCQEPQVRTVGVQTKPYECKKIIEKPSKEMINQIRTEVEEEKDKEVERLKSEHNAEISALQEKHRLHVADIKKKQWCYNCEQEAIYHCCWNTAYCSIECQQLHWQKEHKRVCRRKR